MISRFNDFAFAVGMPVVIWAVALLWALALEGIASQQSAATQAAQPGKSASQFQPTPKQVLGPYFLPNSPLSKDLDLTAAGGPGGNPIKVSGQVLSTDGKLIAGATVHVWLASPKGQYDNQDKNGDPIALAPAKHRLRGRVLTDTAGKYSFKAVRPGNYSVGPNEEDVRPGHIHIQVEAPGFKTLVTQLYFQDDAQHNLHDLPGDDFFKPELALQMQPALPDGTTVQSGIFNFVLDKK